MKNLKTIFGMAAFAIMAVACSNDDDVLNSQQPEQHAKEQGIPFIATISASQADDQTRAVGESGNTFTSNYVKDEQVYLLYQIGNSKYEATATVTEVDGSGNATIEATLESGIANNTEVTLIYPASAAATNKSGNIKDGILSEQVGTLSAVPDIRKGTSTFVVDGGTATLADGTTLAAQYAICKFTIQNLNEQPLPITSLKVTDKSNNVITTVTPGSATDVLYVTLPASTDYTWFEATGSDGKSYINHATASLLAGKAYHPTMKMATVGDGILGDLGNDGKFVKMPHSSAVAVIAYVGKVEKYFDRFLAIALTDVQVGDPTQWGYLYYLSDAKTYGADYADGNPIRLDGVNYNKTKYENNGLTTADYDVVNNSQTTSSATSGELKKGWRIPSVTDWRYVFAGIGGLEPTTPTNPVGIKDAEVYTNSTTLRANINAACCNENLLTKVYWTISDVTSHHDYEWYFNFSNNKTYYNSESSSKSCVRLVFAY
jgi:hypothetical protein